MRKNLLNKVGLYLSLTLFACCAYSSDPIALESEFDLNQISWIKQKGGASIEGEAYIKLEDGSYKGCSGFNMELLPVADYSNERIFKTYGNNTAGQILISQKPPKFTPDVKEYHEFVVKTKCDENNKFLFADVHPGDYYVMAFIIWEGTQGGAAMKRVRLADGHAVTVLKIEESI